MSITHTPAHVIHVPDHYVDSTTGLGFTVEHDIFADDPRNNISDDTVALYQYNTSSRYDTDDVPENIAAQAFAHFYENVNSNAYKALEYTRRFLNIFYPNQFDVDIETINGYSQSDWADVFCAVPHDYGYGTPKNHINEFRQWLFGDVYVVSPDVEDDDYYTLGDIYADSAEEALEFYLESR